MKATKRYGSYQWQDIGFDIFHKLRFNKANLKDLLSTTGLVKLLKLDPDRRFCDPCVTLNFDGWPDKTIGNIFHDPRSCVCHFISICEFKLELLSGNSQIGAKFFGPYDLKIWLMTSKPIQLCVSFHSHWRYSNWSYLKKVTSGQTCRFFLSNVKLKVDGGPWKSMGHLFYATSSLCIIS